MGAGANGYSLCTPTVAHHLVRRLVHLLLAALTCPRTGRALKGTLAASTCRTNIAHQLAERVLDGGIRNGAPSLTMQIVKAGLLLMLAADAVVAPGASLCEDSRAQFYFVFTLVLSALRYLSSVTGDVFLQTNTFGLPHSLI